MYVGSITPPEWTLSPACFLFPGWSTSPSMESRVDSFGPGVVLGSRPQLHQPILHSLIHRAAGRAGHPRRQPRQPQGSSSRLAGWRLVDWRPRGRTRELMTCIPLPRLADSGSASHGNLEDGSSHRLHQVNLVTALCFSFAVAAVAAGL